MKIFFAKKVDGFTLDIDHRVLKKMSVPNI